MLIMSEYSLKKREPILAGEIIRDLIQSGSILKNLKPNIDYGKR